MINKIAVIGAGVIGSGWAVRLLAHNKKVIVYDTNPKLKKKVVLEVKRAWPFVKKLFNKHKLNLKNFSFVTDIQDARPRDGGLGAARRMVGYYSGVRERCVDYVI